MGSCHSRLQGGRLDESASTAVTACTQSSTKSAAAVSSIVADLICAITLELPVDPVTAEDGRVYERSAIEKHVKVARRNGRQLKSPLTNEPMGESLLPAPHMRNHIEALIQSGVINDDVLSQHRKENRAKEDLLKKAHDGHVESIQTVAFYYYAGRRGFVQDYKKSLEWSKKGHVAGSTISTAFLGEAFLYGYGTKPNNSEGLMFLGLAAARGSNFAAYLLAKALTYGYFGMAVDKEEATRWIKKVVKNECAIKHLNEIGMQNAKSLWNELSSCVTADC
ncbi:expressed unknown protein [Seminavis robusta]|uniref:U-box domain-containing protein n=1 Tax=Seminavis robusta TaxID=568900 RepID=A0A9N8H5K3_9STRA|nr:expressed unknown protein [Seminavis robusta]|eukprot:Sro25_g017160.1 n/a (279) ;mRNA; f:125545-126381